MKITFNVTQEDIDNAENYTNTENCLGCTVLKRVLVVNEISMGGHDFHIRRCSWKSPEIRLGSKFANYLLQTIHIYRKVKPETHSLDIPDKILKKIGYFDKKGDTFVDDYIKENNEVRKLPKETKHKRHQMVEEKSH